MRVTAVMVSFVLSQVVAYLLSLIEVEGSAQLPALVAVWVGLYFAIMRWARNRRGWQPRKRLKPQPMPTWKEPLQKGDNESSS